MSPIKFVIYFFIAIFSFGFVACGDDSTDETPLTPEEHKANIQETLQSSLAALQVPQEAVNLDVILSLRKLTLASKVFGAAENEPLMASLNAIARYSQEQDIQGLTVLAAAKEPFGPIAQKYGVYTYSNEVGDFVYTPSSTELKIICPKVFPAVGTVETGVTGIDSTNIKSGNNNIVLTLSAFQASDAPVSGTLSILLDKKERVNLKVTTQVSQAKIGGNATLKIGTSSITVDATVLMGSKDANLDLKVKWNVASNNLMALDLSAVAPMDTIIKYIPEISENRSYFIQQVLISSKLNLTVGLGKIAGVASADMLKMQQSFSAQGADLSMEERTSVLNQHIKTYLKYRKGSSAKIADICFALNSETPSDIESVETIPNQRIVPILVFSDKSQYTMSEYFDEAFMTSLTQSMGNVVQGWMKYLATGGRPDLLPKFD